MKEMNPEDKLRIEKEADEYVKLQGTHDRPDITKHDYISGATSEHERMAELLKEQIELVSTREAEQDVMAADTVRLMDQIEYQKKALKEDYDKITKLEFGLKEERNKAIDECINKVRDMEERSCDDAFIFAYKIVVEGLNKLKGKLQ